MREIKFRAWDKTHEQMINYLRQIEWDRNCHLLDITSYYDVEAKDGQNSGKYRLKAYEVVIMQYTGLKDKNGKEIYEGDIVSMFSGTQTSEVFWDSYGMWQVVAQLSGGSLPGHELIGNLREVAEVIGNIWENPELLASTTE